jgi:hypothetical protein
MPPAPQRFGFKLFDSHFNFILKEMVANEWYYVSVVSQVTGDY